MGMWSKISRIFFFKGMVLAMILGVGSRLIPALTGWAELPKFQISKKADGKQSRLSVNPYWVFHAIAYVVALSLELRDYPVPGSLLLALVVSSIAIRAWKIHRLPNVKTPFAHAIWISCYFILFGLWGNVFFPQYSVHVLHLLYVGGFGSLTMMIASRVVNSHGGYNVARTEKSKIYYFILGILLMASLTRVFAFFVPRLYLSHLNYAAVTWILGIILWCYYFLRRIFVLI